MEEKSTIRKELNSVISVPRSGMRYRTIFLFSLLAAITPLPKRAVAQTQIVHLAISNRYLAKAGSNIIVSQLLLDTLKNPAQFFSEDIQYDKNVVEFIDVTNGAQTPQPSWTVSKTVTTPGNVQISAVSIGAPLVDSGEILRLIFHVVDSAIAFQTSPFLDSAANFGLGTNTISDTGLLRVYDDCTPFVGKYVIPLTMSTYCSPNPASRSLMITYSLPAISPSVRVRLFDASGTCLRFADQGPETIGWHTTSLDVSSLPSGLYYYTVDAGSAVQSHSILVAH